MPTADLPWYLAPLSRRIEDLALRLAVPIALVNLAGTAFGFWYYRYQFSLTPMAAWPLVPDSPLATMFVGLSLLAYRFGYEADWLHGLAFFGALKLGLWTPFVQLFLNDPAGIAAWLYVFLILSHLAMAAEAFVIHRYATFSIPAVAVAVAWYGFNDLVDYFVPVAGRVHHTLIRAERVAGGFNHDLPAHDYAAAVAVVLTLLATFLALSTRIHELRGPSAQSRSA
ncbi:MAG: DUF1405 domain-containing protein [Halodesulfurarchaeum sp.]